MACSGPYDRESSCSILTADTSTSEASTTSGLDEIVYAYCNPVTTPRHASQVEGAGTQRCNGIYRVSPEDAANAHHRTPRLRRSLGAPTYFSQSEEGCFVRMKQYKMLSTQAFWWFIRYM